MGGGQAGVFALLQGYGQSCCVLVYCIAGPASGMLDVLELVDVALLLCSHDVDVPSGLFEKAVG